MLGIQQGSCHQPVACEVVARCREGATNLSTRSFIGLKHDALHGRLFAENQEICGTEELARQLLCMSRAKFLAEDADV